MQIDRGHVRILVALGVLTAAFLISQWLPGYRKVAAMDEGIDTRQVVLERMESAERALQEQKTQMASELSEVFSVAVPVRAGLGPLLEQLSEDLAAELLAVQQLRANAVIDGSDFSRIPIVLQFEGTYPALFKVLRRIESGQRVMRVDRLTARSTSIEPGQPLVVEIELSTFFRTDTGIH